MKKQKTCKLLTCKKRFTPTQFAQVVCDWQCSIAYDKQKKAKKEKKEHVTAKKSFNLSDKPLQKKLSQALVNKFVRTIRDASEPCISCGRYTGQMHAGHYLSIGSHPHLRFNTRNIAKQCSTCNNHLSGNLIEFRKGLVARHSVEFVESLEADQTPRKFSNDEVILIGKYYKGMIKEMES
jgi:hypothetical protein